MKRLLIFLLTLIVLLGGGLAAYRLISGKPLGLRSFVQNLPAALAGKGKAITGGASIQQESRGDFTNLIFLHHSVGANLIREGGLREKFTQAGFSFYDHNYNHIGLTGPDGNPMGYSYSVPDDNTDPEGLAAIFRQQVYPSAVNTLSGLLQHEVILFKSCYTGSQIESDAQLAREQGYFLEMRAVMAAHPDRIFILLTSPPLNPAETSPENARRARAMADWLSAEEFWGAAPNVFIFDLFGALAEDDPAFAEVNMLRAEYRNGGDSHPTRVANETVGPQLVEFIQKSIQTYRDKLGAEG